MQYANYQDKIAYSQEKANKVSLGETSHGRMTLWCLLPGQHIHAHVHAGDHYWVVLEGAGNYLAEGQAKVAVSAGTTLVAPAGESHGIENSGTEGLVFISISAG
jgi:quercetin dioxygenase-like cupin family protein